MSDAQFRRLLRQTVIGNDPSEIEEAIQIGYRLGYDYWDLLEMGIPLDYLATEIAKEKMVFEPSSLPTYMIENLQIEIDPSNENVIKDVINNEIWLSLKAMYGRYPPMSDNWSYEDYWSEKTKDYYLLPDETLICHDLDQGTYIERDPFIISEIKHLVWQSEAIDTARNILAKRYSFGDPIQEEVLRWACQFQRGKFAQPLLIKNIFGEEIPFYQVGRNSNCQFYVGVLHGQRYDYRVCIDDIGPPEGRVRAVEDFSGYHGHE